MGDVWFQNLLVAWTLYKDNEVEKNRKPETLKLQNQLLHRQLVDEG